VRSLVVARRTRTLDPQEIPEISFYLSNLPPRKGCAQSFARLLRGHWAGSENRNHWVRDHCLREDRTRLGSYSANCVLAGLRVCLLVIKSLLYAQTSWPELAERCQHTPAIALAALTKLQAK
jgi:hypothetical protein